MSLPTPHHDASLMEQCEQETERLATIAGQVLDLARAAGADQAEVAASVDEGLSVSVRMGDVETIERTRDRGFALTVYFGKRKGSASTADLAADSIGATVDQACAIARYTGEDACNGLADLERMATEFPELDLWHPWALDADRAGEIGLEVEDAGRAVDGVSRSEGASVDTGQGISVYANSHGFLGRRRGSMHSLSCALIAGEGAAMQRDYWYDSARAASDLASAASIGLRAGERTVARRGARAISTRESRVLFVPELARGLIGHLLAAVAGSAQYRHASFLQDHLGKQVLPEWVSIIEKPHLPRGMGSRAFDSEGVATRESALVENGVLARYLLGSYSARRLGLATTGNAGGIHNLEVSHGADDFDAMLGKLGTGLVVTELMGQGVSILTGDYSRGAAGFWVENGEIIHPVEEVTIAGNLRDMLGGILAVGADVDHRSSVLTGSILINRMTIAGS